MNYKDLIPHSMRELAYSDVEIIDLIKLWRKNQLTSCDWTQLPDVDLANKLDWVTYRQALRDLPQQGPDPKVWVFPVPPT